LSHTILFIIYLLVFLFISAFMVNKKLYSEIWNVVGKIAVVLFKYGVQANKVHYLESKTMPEQNVVML